LPVVDQLAQEYGNQVAFVAVAWKGTFEDTAERAAELMPSGSIRWGLDEEEAIFELF
jgi:thiol-disulfide isomerase/thioredoxin